MKSLWLIIILLLWKPARSQDSCRPHYGKPVRMAQIEGMNLAYVEEGKGKTILFVHGLGGNLSHWLKLMPLLADNYHCIAVDLPGYGFSDKVLATGGRDQIEFFADVLADFLQKMKIKKAMIAGHSMGAQVAMVMGLKYRKLVSRLILVAPAGLEVFNEKEAQLLTSVSTPSVFAQQDEKNIRNNFKMNFFTWPGDAEQLVIDRLRMKDCADFKRYTEVVSAGVKGMLAHPVKNDLDKIRQPVLILFGADDALIPNRFLHPGLTKEDLVNDALNRLKRGRSVMIPKAGHMVLFEKSEETAQAIKNFLP